MILLKTSNNGDFIYLDVVTQYSKGFSNQVSQHPVDGLGVVSDHVTKNNNTIQLSARITGADFNFSKPRLNSEERSFIGIDQIVVSSDVATELEVSYDNNPYNLLPDVIGQFFSDTLPNIENVNEGKGASYSERILYKILTYFSERRVELSLYEFEGDSVVGEPIPRLFITNLDINETSEEGDALLVDISLEQVTVSNLIEEEIPEYVALSFREKAEEKKANGAQTGSTGDRPKADTSTMLRSRTRN